MGYLVQSMGISVEEAEPGPQVSGEECGDIGDAAEKLEYCCIQVFGRLADLKIRPQRATSTSTSHIARERKDLLFEFTIHSERLPVDKKEPRKRKSGNTARNDPVIAVISYT